MIPLTQDSVQAEIERMQRLGYPDWAELVMRLWTHHGRYDGARDGPAMTALRAVLLRRRFWLVRELVGAVLAAEPRAGTKQAYNAIAQLVRREWLIRTAYGELEVVVDRLPAPEGSAGAMDQKKVKPVAAEDAVAAGGGVR